MSINKYKNPYDSQLYAPYGYCFFNAKGQKLGRVIWTKNVEGIYLDKCDEEWGI